MFNMRIAYHMFRRTIVVIEILSLIIGFFSIMGFLFGEVFG
jgi:hypothetical protein